MGFCLARYEARFILTSVDRSGFWVMHKTQWVFLRQAQPFLTRTCSPANPLFSSIINKRDRYCFPQKYRPSFPVRYYSQLYTWIIQRSHFWSLYCKHLLNFDCKIGETLIVILSWWLDYVYCNRLWQMSHDYTDSKSNYFFVHISVFLYTEYLI